MGAVAQSHIKKKNFFICLFIKICRKDLYTQASDRILYHSQSKKTLKYENWHGWFFVTGRPLAIVFRRSQLIQFKKPTNLHNVRRLRNNYSTYTSVRSWDKLDFFHLVEKNYSKMSNGVLIMPN